MTDEWRARLTKARKDARLSQAALAKLVHLSQSTIGAYETGPNQVDLATLTKIADALGVTPEWIGFDHECPKQLGAPDDLDRQAVREVARAMVALLRKLDIDLSPEKFAANLVGLAEQHRDDSTEKIAAHIESYLKISKS
jgi:transcriptional regulator with XRE-family HTH domain